MGIRTLIGTRSGATAIYAAGLLTALVAALLGAWFVSGWHDVRTRQQQARLAPRAAAAQRADVVARALHAELEALVAREVRRPYYHYQNLIHDPQSSAALNVSPSPLARGTDDDQLVLGYFQLDRKGRATTPTVNDDVPELSEPEKLADNRAFRDRVARDLSRHLTPASSPHAEPTPAVTAARQPQQAQVIKVDPNVYVQNVNPNAVYSQQQARLPPAPPLPARPPAPVTIVISPFEWRTLPFAGQPALLAIRHVQTPDGPLAQGFVVNASTLTRRLATQAGDMVAALHPDDSRGAAIAPGWGLTVEPNPRTLAQAADDADAVARAFLIRFGGIGSIAVLAAASVVLLVMRAEKLARERSQFAAAAAHELRTPLAGLQLYGDMLADGLGDPAKTREYARRMSEDVARLGRVVTNVLGVSQLERGNLSVDAREGPLGEELRDLAERARPPLDRQGAALEIDVAPDLRARFDRDALERIVGNLLDNAEKYGRGARDRTIRLAARYLDDDVEVSVEDRGPGILDSTKLFRAFSRGVSGDGPAGLGLGLALSMSLARAMGGELSYRPRDGGGAAFVLRLPRA